jgi:hypothetical protein
MAISLSREQARLLRIISQKLVFRASVGNDSPASVARLVRDLCGVQAQDVSAASLAVRARCMGLVEGDLKRALFEDRSVIRTWLMRGTLHLIAVEDLDWILALMAPRFIRSGRGRRMELGLDEDTGAKGVRAISKLLRGGTPLTRREIARHLDELGIPTAGQAIIHLIRLAALQGVLCYGPDREGQETFVFLEDWIERGSPLPEEQAQVELARRYLAAYAPAAPEDFAAWSGLPLGMARAAWEKLTNEIIEVEIEGEAAWIGTAQAEGLDLLIEGTPIVNLLPNFDPYLLGYRNRNLSVPKAYAKRIHPGGGMLRPAVLVDGLAAGVWKIKRGKKGLAVTIEPFGGLKNGVETALEVEVGELGRYYDQAPTLNIAPNAM